MLIFYKIDINKPEYKKIMEELKIMKNDRKMKNLEKFIPYISLFLHRYGKIWWI